jgi:hypothetical protein
VSVTDSPPFGNVTRTAGIELDGRTAEAILTHANAGLFSTLKLPIVLGRNFAPGERHVIVVSQSFARRLWPNENPIGKQLPAGNDEAGRPISNTVIGVSRDAHFVRLEDPDITQFYFPAESSDLPGASLVLRTATDPKPAIPSIAAVLKSIDPAVLPTVNTLSDSLRYKLRGPEATAIAATVLGCAALALACLGLVGVIAYTISQRTRDIGIRVALGAKPADVLHAVLRQFAPPVVIGLTLGIGAAAALAHVLRSVLFGLSGFDPLAYLAAIAAFALAVSVFAWLPARRALRIDPAVCLRCD